MKILKWIWNNIELLLGGICLSVIVIVVSVNIIFRYLLNNPISWTFELSTILFVWLVMFGSAAAAFHRLHPSIDFLTSFLPGKSKKIVESIVMLVVSGLMLFITILSWNFAITAGLQKFTAIFKIPYISVYFALPVGFGLMFLRIFTNCIINFKESKSTVNEKNDYNIGGL